MLHHTSITKTYTCMFTYTNIYYGNVACRLCSLNFYLNLMCELQTTSYENTTALVKMMKLVFFSIPTNSLNIFKLKGSSQMTCTLPLQALCPMTLNGPTWPALHLGETFQSSQLVFRYIPPAK